MFIKNLDLQRIDHLKDYVPLECLGEGAFGTIHLCQCKQIHNDKDECNERFVVKRIRYKTRFGIRQHDISRFRNEFDMGVLLHHPNIRKTFDIDVNCKHIVFENCPGIDLLDYLNLYKSLNTKPLISLYNQILDAVCYLHECGIAHLDLKLENIVLNTNTNVLKLIDFGEAVHYIQKKSDDIYEEFYFIGARGTYQYISPEQVDLLYFSAPLSDVWACGIIFYNLLYNKMPWSIANTKQDCNYRLHYNSTQGDILNKTLFKKMEYLTDTEWNIIKYLFKISLHPSPRKRRSAPFIRSVFNLMIFD